MPITATTRWTILVSANLLAGPTARTTTHSFDPGSNRLTNITSTNAAYSFGIGYDARGNVTQRGSQSFVFDQANRLTSATGKGSYAYDGFGRRVSTVGADGVNRVTAYSQEGQLLVARPTTIALAAGTKYIHLRNHVIAESSPAGTTYMHTDGLGSPVAITNSSGGLVSRTRYEPYGLTASGATPTIGFTGHVNAPEIGLVYMQQRYYDPVAGRFLSIDPVVTDANTGESFNRYHYANNNPYTNIDPDGSQWRRALAKAIAETAVKVLTKPVAKGVGSGVAAPGRSGALNAAKRDLGIPRAQGPSKVEKVDLTDKDKKTIIDKEGQPVKAREYHYDSPREGKVIIQEHSAGHKFGKAGGEGDQGPHFNVRPPENPRTGEVAGRLPCLPRVRQASRTMRSIA